MAGVAKQEKMGGGWGWACIWAPSELDKGKPGGDSTPLTVQKGRAQAGVPLLREGVAGLRRESDSKNLPGTVRKGFRAPPSDSSVFMFFMVMSHVGGGEGECGLGVRAGLSVGERGQNSHLCTPKGLSAASEIRSPEWVPVFYLRVIHLRGH